LSIGGDEKLESAPLGTAIALAIVELSPGAQDAATKVDGDGEKRLLAPFCGASLNGARGGSTE
jgi:hypothetical protein